MIITKKIVETASSKACFLNRVPRYFPSGGRERERKRERGIMFV